MDELKIATINLHNRANRWRERRHLLVNQIYDAEPDLISLQEVYFPIRQGQWLRNQINIRLAQAGKLPYRLYLSRKRHLPGGYYEGVGVLTKFPVRYKDSVNLGYGGHIALRLNVELPSHQTLDFVAVQLDPTTNHDDIRHEQVLRLTGWLNGRGKVPLQIVAGDFNEIPQSLAILRMKQGYKSAYESIYGREPLATYPTALSLVSDDENNMETELTAKCLDYIFVSSPIQVKTISLFCNKHAIENDFLYPSEHVGLLATIRCAF